jgi:hypothetical protein
LKRAVSIGLILILLLNVLGYYGIFLGLKYRNSLSMTKVLDANSYDESQAITIKIPVSIPYMSDQNDFKRVDGNIEHQGDVYRLVKQKYSHDTLTVVCVRDNEGKRLNKALNTYVKTFADKEHDRNSNTKHTLDFIKDYLTQPFSMRSASAGWETDVAYNSFDPILIQSFSSSVTQPPELA